MSTDVARSQVRRMARLLHPSTSKARMLAVYDLTAYMDESGTHGGASIVVGGYLAAADEWERFEAAWMPVINREGLTAFHAADCMARIEEFKGWKWERCDRVYRELISIIGQHNFFAAAMAIVTEDFRSLVSTPELKRDIGTEYHMAMQKCFGIFAQLLKEAPDAPDEDELIAYVFEIQDEFAGRALDIYQGILKYHDGKRVYRLGGIAYEDAVEFVPLQAADIIVYETYREMDRKLKRKYDNPNPYFKALTANGENILGFFDREKLEEMLSSPNAIDTRY